MDYYHIFNRGVDKRTVFLDESDHLRFVHDLYVMNDRNTVAHPKQTQRERKRDLLVYIHAWCLMSNHYHLLLSPVDDDEGNVSLFMKKLNMGYTKFFNEKYKRSGALWQGKYKKVLIGHDSQFMYIPYYVHLNPLDFTSKEWRDGAVKNSTAALTELRAYRWSSLNDYLGLKNFPSLIHQKSLGHILGSAQEQFAEMKKIITDKGLAVGSKNIEEW